MRLTNLKLGDIPHCSNPAMLVIGGYGSDPETELSVTKYSYPKGQWTVLGEKNCIVKAAIVKVGFNRVWIIGGKAKGQRLSSITELDTETGHSKVIATALTKPKSGCGAVLIDGTVSLIRPRVRSRGELWRFYPRGHGYYQREHARSKKRRGDEFEAG